MKKKLWEYYCCFCRLKIYLMSSPVSNIPNNGSIMGTSSSNLSSCINHCCLLNRSFLMNIIWCLMDISCSFTLHLCTSFN
uniref:Ovule protein n=1 Tax=Panagrolaimus sp. ES5 TaxID=591445 RepID=A0AC34GLE2_9BILA